MQGAALNPWTGELWTHEHGPQGGDEVNIRALEADEPAMRRVGRLIVMSGAIEAPGNLTSTAEFNFHVSPSPSAARSAFDRVSFRLARRRVI